MNYNVKRQLMKYYVFCLYDVCVVMESLFPAVEAQFAFGPQKAGKPAVFFYIIK